MAYDNEGPDEERRKIDSVRPGEGQMDDDDLQTALADMIEDAVALVDGELDMQRA